MTNIGQAARSRSRKIREELAKRGQIEHHTETRVDLAQGDRERITSLENQVIELEEALLRALQSMDRVYPEVLNLMTAASALAEGQGRLARDQMLLEDSSNKLAESIKIMGRGVVRRDVA